MYEELTLVDRDADFFINRLTSNLEGDVVCCCIVDHASSFSKSRERWRYQAQSKEEDSSWCDPVDESSKEERSNNQVFEHGGEFVFHLMYVHREYIRKNTKIGERLHSIDKSTV